MENIPPNTREIIINQNHTPQDHIPDFPSDNSKISKTQFIEWPLLLDKLFNNEIIPGLEKINVVNFNRLLAKQIINQYTMYIDGQFMYYALKSLDGKITFKKLLRAEKLSESIYYYTVWDKGHSPALHNFLGVIKHLQIKGIRECADLSMFKKSPRRLREKIYSMITPQMIVDMLSLLYNDDEVNRNINAVVIISNNLQLIPAMKELVNNDVIVYLAVSKYITTSPRMMRAASSIIDLEDYLDSLGAIHPK